MSQDANNLVLNDGRDLGGKQKMSLTTEKAPLLDQGENTYNNMYTMLLYIYTYIYICQGLYRYM